MAESARRTVPLHVRILIGLVAGAATGGTLNLNNGTAIGTGRLTLSGGTLDNNTLAALTLTNNNPQTWAGNFTFNGTSPMNTGTGAVSLVTASTISVNLNPLTIPGAISGTTGFSKAGPGNLILTGANNYIGGTNVNAGTLTGNTTSIQGGFADGSVLIFDQTINAVTDGTFTGTVNGPGAINFANGTVRLASSSVLRNFGGTTVNGKLVGPASGGLNAFSNISSYDVEGTLDLGASGQTIAVRYTGWLANGTQFDSNTTLANPLTFKVGSGQVIAGFDEALVGAKVGSRRQLLIPPSLGYGPYDYGPIPGNSVLVFNVEVISVQ